MTDKSIYHQILRHFPHEPTSDQQSAIRHINAFDESSKPNPVYLLKGFAGTGKTSLVSAYVQMLAAHHKKFVLLAPTGRAAKVLSKYTGRSAHTIHRYIYQISTSGEGFYKIQLAHNRSKNTVFIIDEASMISDSSQNGGAVFGGRNLFEDLVTYVFSNENNKMILVGDTAQLPPVGLDVSPALDLSYIKSSFHVTAYEFEMKEVMRQELDSGILATATRLREMISREDAVSRLFFKEDFKTDIEVIDDGNTFEELLHETFDTNDMEQGIVVCRTNKRANLFNRQVRNNILARESEIEGGDVMMVVKNNYYWLDKDAKAGFIANGDIIKAVRVKRTEDMYGFRFADADILLVDYPEEKEFSVKLLLSTIYSEGPGLSETERNTLFRNIEEDYRDIADKNKRMNEIMKNPWYNALHVKFAYAMTCHKTQGGQWPHVFVDQGYLTDEMINTEYLRWLYTAVTRATVKLYLVNFNPAFFG
jgi:exodeoxyribonuclease-5